jgi:hypothetical protein
MLMRLSQGQLNLLEQCPRRFQHVYLDQLGAPLPPEQQSRIEWGNRFHLGMQQRELGLPWFGSANDPLQQCIESFRRATPDLFSPMSNQFRQSEHRRSLEFEGYLLTVVYDLLILEESQAQILDWKTYPRPKQAKWLQQNWQTRLYPLVLKETDDYSPEQISMTYWFVEPAFSAEAIHQPASLTFAYSTRQHEQNSQDLAQRLQQLTQWLQDYEQGIPLPQVALSEDRCSDCCFAVRCQRNGNRESHGNPLLPQLEEIQEITI